MKTLRYVVTAGLMLAIAGCDRSAVEPQGQTGTLQVNMIDSPAAYDQVNIVVDSVQAHIAIDDTTAGWFTLSTTPATYDLLVYVNGSFAVIGSAELPVGRYSQVRLFIGSGSNVVVDGQTKPLAIPSGVQSGVKLLINATITADQTTTITLDFDANLSVVKSGNPVDPTYSLRPVIRTTTSASTGFIAGVVSPATSRPTIWARSSTGVTLTTTTDASGGFRFLCLTPDTYTVEVVSNDDLYAARTITGVNVGASATVDLGTISLENK